MSQRRFCCFSCWCDSTPITPDGTVSWFSHSVSSSGVITRIDHQDPCKTYYVNSASGGGAETGTGTPEDPWSNLNTVFGNDCIASICSNPATCPMVRVLVKGTLDYRVTGHWEWDYGRRLVIEPWDIAVVTAAVNDDVVWMIYCRGCIFKNISCAVTYPPGAVCFWNCSHSSFYHCQATATSDNEGNTQDYSVGYGFWYCEASHFEDCDGIGIGRNAAASYWTWNCGVGFYNCGSYSYDETSTFNSCTGTGTALGTKDINGFGFYFENTDGIFNECTGTGTATSVDETSGLSCSGGGFYQHDAFGSVFLACQGVGTANAIETGCQSQGGFGFIGPGVFRNCTGIGSGSGGLESSGYGFAYNNAMFAAFYSCSGEGYASYSDILRACGFYQNSGAAFNNCSTTDRICVGGADCDDFVCDI